MSVNFAHRGYDVIVKRIGIRGEWYGLATIHDDEGRLLSRLVTGRKSGAGAKERAGLSIVALINKAICDRELMR